MAHYLVTGASSGIGEALAIELGRRGHTLGLVARSADKLEAVAVAVRAAGGKAAWAAADVTDKEATWAAIRHLEAELGPVDCLVANAGGGGGPTPAAKSDVERILSDMRVNYDGSVNALAAVLPRMVAERRGHVAVVSSVAGYRGVPPGGAYSAAKGAIQILLEAWSAELRGSGVTVTTINPGFVKTPLTDKNKFPMPFLIGADAAARIMADGLERKRRYIVFPWQMRWLSHVWRNLPWWAFEAGAKGLAPNPKNMKKGVE